MNIELLENSQNMTVWQVMEWANKETHRVMALANFEMANEMVWQTGRQTVGQIDVKTPTRDR